MKIKLTKQGFNTLTGTFGGLEFKNGVSVDHVSTREAERLGSITGVVDAATNETINADKGFKRRLGQNEAMSKEEHASKSDKADDVSDEDKADDVSDEDKAEQADGERKIYSEAELGEIADKEGITGLREIGDELGVSAKSVKSLIVKILEAQKA